MDRGDKGRTHMHTRERARIPTRLMTGTVLGHKHSNICWGAEGGQSFKLCCPMTPRAPQAEQGHTT